MWSLLAVIALHVGAVGASVGQLDPCSTPGLLSRVIIAC